MLYKTASCLSSYTLIRISQNLYFVLIPFWIDHHFETLGLSVSAACRVGMYGLVAALGRLFWECRAQPVSSQWPVSQESALYLGHTGTGHQLHGHHQQWHRWHPPILWHPPGADMWPGLQWRVGGMMSPMVSESHSNKLLGILLLSLHIDVLQVECQKGFINFPVSNSEGNFTIIIPGRE